MEKQISAAETTPSVPRAGRGWELRPGIEGECGASNSSAPEADPCAKPYSSLTPDP